MRTRARKIVAVKFDDGTEVAVSDTDLKRYLEARDIEAACVGSLGIKPWEMKAMVDATVKLRREEASETNSKNATPPRNEFAKREDAKKLLLECKDAYERSEGKTRGWKKKACDIYRIDPKTLNKILVRPKSTRLVD